jgi:hypothetical protein
MGCGSILGDLFYLADSLLESPRTQFPPQIDYRGGNEGLHAQLYQMYGQGLINDEVFNALRVLAGEGKLRPADLAVHRANARRRPPRKADSEVQNALRGLHLRLVQLTAARTSSEKVLADMEARLANLDQGVIAKERNARQAVGENDEDTARRRLTEKIDLAGSHAQLAVQEHALREELARLDHLRTQLETKVAELEAVSAREELAEINGM